MNIERNREGDAHIHFDNNEKDVVSFNVPEIRDYLELISPEKWGFEGWDDKNFKSLRFTKPNDVLQTGLQMFVIMKDNNGIEYNHGDVDFNKSRQDILDVMSDEDEAWVRDYLVKNEYDFQALMADEKFQGIFESLFDGEAAIQAAWIEDQNTDWVRPDGDDRDYPLGRSVRLLGSVSAKLTEYQYEMVERLRNLQYILSTEPHVSENSYGVIYAYDDEGNFTQTPNPEYLKIKGKIGNGDDQEEVGDNAAHLIIHSKANPSSNKDGAGFYTMNFDGIKQLKKKIVEAGEGESEISERDLESLLESTSHQSLKPKYETYADFVNAILDGHEPACIEEEKKPNPLVSALSYIRSKFSGGSQESSKDMQAAKTKLGSIDMPVVKNQKETVRKK